MDPKNQLLTVHCLISLDTNQLHDTQTLSPDWCEHLNGLDCFKSRGLKWIPLSDFIRLSLPDLKAIEERYWWMDI